MANKGREKSSKGHPSIINYQSPFVFSRLHSKEEDVRQGQIFQNDKNDGCNSKFKRSSEKKAEERHTEETQRVTP